MTAQHLGTTARVSRTRRAMMALAMVVAATASLVEPHAAQAAAPSSVVDAYCNAARHSVEVRTAVYGPAGQWVSVQMVIQRYDKASRSFYDVYKPDFMDVRQLNALGTTTYYRDLKTFSTAGTMRAGSRVARWVWTKERGWFWQSDPWQIARHVGPYFDRCDA